MPATTFAEFVAAREATAEGRSPPPGPFIERAIYRATLIDNALQGAFEARVLRLSDAPSLLDLGSPTAALSDLRWETDDAAWGTAPDGRCLLVVDSPEQALSGRWSRQGRTVFDRIEFDIALVPAASSRAELRIPAGWRLSSSAGVVSQPVGVQDGWSVWAVELGRWSHCRWTIARGGAPAGPALILADRALSYSVRPDGCHVQADFALQILDAPMDRMVLNAPSGFELSGVTYTGDVPLPVEALEAEGRARLLVTLPNQEAGRRGTVRLRGKVPLPQEQPWTLPQITLEQSLSLSGTQAVRVDDPLVVKSLTMDGLRQTGLAVDNDRGETWTFEELRPDALVIIHVGRPEPSLTAQVLTCLTTGIDALTLDVTAAFRAAAGSTFRAELRWPDSWDIVDVKPAPGTRDSALASWRIAPHNDGGRVLSIEFRRALSPLSPKQIIVTARSTTGEQPRQLDLPVPLHCDDARVLLAVRRRAAQPALELQTSGLNPVADDAVQKEWSSLLTALGPSIGSDTLEFWTAGAPLGPSRPVLRWSSRSGSAAPEAAVSIPPEPAGETEVTLQLRSWLGSGSSTEHLHEAVIRAKGTLPSTLQFRLPAPASLVDAATDGSHHEVTVSGPFVQLDALASSVREVSLRYRTPADRASLRRRSLVPVPQGPLPVVGFDWDIVLPAGQRLTDLPEHVRSAEGDALLPWPARLLGPLAPQTVGAAATVDRTGSVVRLTLLPAETPATITLDTWAGTSADMIAWACLTGSLLLWTVLRRQGWQFRARAASVWCAVSLGSALALPDCYAGAAGALLIGCLVACWLPERVVCGSLPPWTTATIPPRRALSTSSSVAGALLLMALWTHVRAQTPDAARPGPAPNNAAPSASGSAEEAGSGTWDVLVPVDDQGRRTVVYVGERLRTEFTDWTRQRAAAPPWLLRSVRYEIGASDRVRAEFKVAILSPDAVVAVEFHFSGITFQDPHDCLVNGQRSAIRPAADGEGVIVEVRRQDHTSAPPGPAPQPASPATGAPGDRATDEGTAVPWIADVTLWFRPARATAADGERLIATVPAIPDARLVSAEGPAPTWDATSRLGAVQRPSPMEVPVVELGPTDRLELALPVNDVSPRPAEWRGTAVSSVEVAPMRLRVRTQLALTELVGDGAPERTLVLLLPPQAYVREVSHEALNSFAARRTAAADTRLELDFLAPPAAGSRINVDFSVPLTPSMPGVPALVWLPEGRLLRHRVGLRAASGYRLAADPRNTTLAAVRELATDAFLLDQPAGAAWPTPDVAYELSAAAPLAVTLSPLRPLSTGSLEQVLRFGSDTLRWQANAELGVTVSPAFQHDVVLDPRLRIEAVSVEQDSAERVLRWTRTDDGLTIFLRGDKTGPQRLGISGFLPFAAGELTELPTCDLPRTQMLSSELVLRSETGRNVELFGAEGPVTTPGGSGAPGVPLELGRFSTSARNVPRQFVVAPDGQEPPAAAAGPIPGQEPQERNEAASEPVAGGHDAPSAVAAPAARERPRREEAWQTWLLAGVGAAGVLLVASAWWALDRRWRIGERIGRDSWLGVTVLGVLWWQFAAVGVLGLVLAILGIVLEVGRLRERPSPEPGPV